MRLLLRYILINRDPWAGACGRETCFLCQRPEGAGKCMRKGVVYSIECLVCTKAGKKGVYWWETARTPYDRGLEHLTALRNRDLNSPLWAHHQEVHGEDNPEFTMKVVKVHHSTLGRQAHEGNLINNYVGDYVLNRKGEWGQNLAPALGLEDQSNSEGRLIRQKRPPPSGDKQGGSNPKRTRMTADPNSDSNSDRGVVTVETAGVSELAPTQMEPETVIVKSPVIIVTAPETVLGIPIVTHSRNVSQTETVAVIAATNNVQGVHKIQQSSFNSLRSDTNRVNNVKRRQVMNVKDLLQRMKIKATSKKSETSGAGGPVLPPPPCLTRKSQA